MWQTYCKLAVEIFTYYIISNQIWLLFFILLIIAEKNIFHKKLAERGGCISVVSHTLDAHVFQDFVLLRKLMSRKEAGKPLPLLAV